jgi:succinate dehydrogenase / fumarate reductase flavoprotein subunit
LRELEADLLEIRKGPVRTGCRPGEIRKRLQRMMVKCAGVIRSAETLENASGCLRELKSDLSEMHASSPWESAEALETKAMVTVSEIVVRSAVERRESRGAHYRLDCPKEDDKWLRNILVQRQADEMVLRTRSRVVVEPNLKQET